MLPQQERASELMEGLEPISDAYNRATASASLSSDLEKIIPLALAYGSWEKRRLVALEGEASQEAFGNIITALETALEAVKKGTLSWSLASRWSTKLSIKPRKPETQSSGWRNS
jgi:hypothetical protein